MKIVKLTAENIKRLVAVEITPDGDMVMITGKNKQGKTSVLDSIWWALAGTKHIQASPIRKGQTKARIKLELGELTVERKFTKGGENGEKINTSLVVTNSEGAKYPSPQTMLDALLGELSFDPLGFMRLSPADQREAFKQFVDEDLDALEAQSKDAYDRRTRVNREAKERRAQAEALPVPTKTVDLINVDDLIGKLDEAGKHNSELEKRKAGREQAERDLKAIEHRIDQLEEQLRNARGEHDELEAKINNAEPLPEPINTSDLRAEIKEAEAKNEVTKQMAKRSSLEAEAEQFEKSSAELTDLIDSLSKRKADAIAGAELPIEGLALDDKQVLFNDVPLDQASDAEQLRISVAIAASLNPKLRVIRVRDGSLLDSDGLKLLGEFAQEHDMQVWVERVDESGEVGFVLEDGHLKG